MSAASGEGGPLRRWRGAGMVSLEMLDRPGSFCPGSVMNARRHAERFRCLYVSTVIPLGRKRPCFDERDIPQSHRRSRSFFSVSMVNAGSPTRRSSRMEMQDECHADPHPYPGHNLCRYSCHPGLAVLRRCGQTNHRERVPAAWLVGAAGRTNCVQRSRHDRLGGASCPFSRSAEAQRNIARSRRDTANRRPDRDHSRADHAQRRPTHGQAGTDDAQRRPARRWPRADDGRDQQAAGGRTTDQAATGAGTQLRAAVGASTDGALTGWIGSAAGSTNELFSARRIPQPRSDLTETAMSRMIKFAKAGGPEVLELVEVQVPAPAPNEVRIKVKAIGINRAEAMWRVDESLLPLETFPTGCRIRAVVAP